MTASSTGRPSPEPEAWRGDSAAPGSRAPRPSNGLETYKRIIRRLFKDYAGPPFRIRFWTGESLAFGGDGAPPFTINLHSIHALRHVDEDHLVAAFHDGHWDIEGDVRAVFAIRPYLPRKPSLVWRLGLLARIFLVPDTWNNKKGVTDHYSLGDDFYLSFIDKRHHIYSHGHFRSENETLEEAQEHKLEDMFAMLGLERGMRLLDIGGGWGPVPAYCGARGVTVTSLTLARDSQSYIQRLIDDRKLPCEVRLEDLFDHHPSEPYDAIVIFGVIEHIPQYKRFVAKSWELLKPGGLMYLDASASRVKYAMGAITRRNLWTATCAYLSLHDLIAELNYQGMDILEVKNESRDYELTMMHWSQRFEAARDFIVGRWGDRIYRMFLIYLWGGCIGFRDDGLQAYRVLIRRNARPGPRPGIFRRILLSAQAGR